MSAASTTQGEPTYVAHQLDKSWLLNEQRRLHERSRTNPDYVFQKLWGLVTDLRNLRIAFARVCRNRGARTAGIDGITIANVLGSIGGDPFIDDVRARLRSGAYQPSPVRRKMIPKPGQPGKYRALGIPTVTDRVVQAALKNILEPIFEADFFPVSYGFRPSKCAHGALEHLRLLLRPKNVRGQAGVECRLSYQWAIEGDIKGCFDNIDHHALMVRVRRRVGDAKVTRLVLAFLKAGVMAEGTFLRTDTGSPQGGILSPLLSNVALAAIEERYARWVWPSRTPKLATDPAVIRRRANKNRLHDRNSRVSFVPVRYADDFIVLVNAPPGPEQEERARVAALAEKDALAKDLKDQLGLELSETKTLVTPVTDKLRFLGHQVTVRPWRGVMDVVALIPKDRSQRIREVIKNHFRRCTVGKSLGDRLRKVNPIIRGWCNYYRHARGAKRVFSQLDHYVWWTIFRWLRKKHRVATRRLIARYGRQPGRRSVMWHDGETNVFAAAKTPVHPYRFWVEAKPPAFVSNIYGEPDA
jgi:group II intron reverse transcriptase/maturase